MASGQRFLITEGVPSRMRFAEAVLQKQGGQLFRLTLFIQELVGTGQVSNSRRIHWTEAVCAGILVWVKPALGKFSRLEFWSARGD